MDHEERICSLIKQPQINKFKEHITQTKKQRNKQEHKQTNKQAKKDSDCFQRG